jgi:hypothetical protein
MGRELENIADAIALGSREADLGKEIGTTVEVDSSTCWSSWRNVEPLRVV